MNSTEQTNQAPISELPPYTSAVGEPTNPAPAKLAPTNVVQNQPEVAVEMTTKAQPATAQATVTPLNQLGDQPQWIDCEFCQRRTQTRLVKEGTGMQMVAGAVCCLFCICLTCVPCLAGWFENTTYFCSNCNQKVAMRPHDGPVQVYTRENQSGAVPSRFPAAPPPAQTK